MYSHKAITNFIDKVVSEASEAAQKVFDKHEPELNRMIRKQLRPGDRLLSGMGTVGIYPALKRDETAADNMADALTRTQYWNEVEAGFNIKDIK